MKKIHFIGIGGIGMSALADICLARGDLVTGSDLRPNNLTDALSAKGAIVRGGHASENVPQSVDLVVRSSCIRSDNPEMIKAKKLNAPVILRGEMLKDILQGFSSSIGVTGTHGKTTTSSLIAHIAEFSGEDPTVILGGEVECFKGNSKSGKSGLAVAEVDESDGFFKNIGVTCAVVTNIEREHMENYGSWRKLVGAYMDFIAKISPWGLLVYNAEDAVVRRLAKRASVQTISFGISGDFDITCRNASYAASIEFDLIVRGKSCGKVKSSLIGRYNVMNILGAAAACIEIGISPEQIKEAIASFKGAKRRFESVGKVGTVEVVEDYAHHPTELKSVIKAAGDYSKGRVVTIFQPHRYSRTKDLMREFTSSFYGSDILLLTDIYSADEDAAGSVKIRDLYEAIDKKRFERFDLIDKKDIPEAVAGLVKEGDIVLVLGAGDIREISSSIVKRIEEALC